jgi:ssRNA-specific RNase YbeY (16S rRNA maturation enzyme)
MGYDHEAEEDLETMEQIEKNIQSEIKKIPK